MRKLLAANQEYASGFSLGSLPARPHLGLAVLTCMDARLDPARALGLSEGDAHVIRNAGGRASDDAIRSLTVSHLVAGVSQFAVIHHTDCAMMMHADETLRSALAARGVDASGVEFLTFDSLSASVREDVDRLRSSPFFADTIVVRGYVYRVEDGVLAEVR